jgi:hypothetical protein
MLAAPAPFSTAGGLSQMTVDAILRCQCGEVEGRVTDASPKKSYRIVCYCSDCQAFLHYLGRSDLLDPQGGTDVVQVAPGSLAFGRGEQRIVGLRLTPDGLYRWYTSCCRTPVGNTLSPAIPFVGIVAKGFLGTLTPDDLFGKPRGAIRGEHAIGRSPPGSTGLKLGLLAGAARLILGWRLAGATAAGTWPHPFFDRATRMPSRPLTILTPSERDALRPLCGPRAS